MGVGHAGHILVLLGKVCQLCQHTHQLFAHQLKTLMRRFCDGGGAIFFSTHVLEVAEKLCDRVAILRKGQLVREGAMEQVRGDDTLEEVFLELEDTGEAL